MVDETDRKSTARAAVEEWLGALLVNRAVSAACRQVISAVMRDPAAASNVSVVQFAETNGVHVSSVTRAAQAVGFGGWPAFREELRARYLGVMTLAQVGTVHATRSTSHPLDDVLDRNIDDLKSLRKSLDRSAVRRITEVLAAARRRFVVATGSFAAIGKVLVHNAGLAGYHCELIEEPAGIANALAGATPADLVFCFSLWRIYKSTILAARQAKARGATVCAMTDQATSPLAEACDHLLLVRGEGSSIFMSLLPSLAVVDVLLASLVRLAPERTRASILAAEEQWLAFDLLHHGATDS